MNEQPKTRKQGLPSNGDPLVRVEGVSKIFCRSLKRSLNYGLLDSLGDILPVRKRKHNDYGEPILRKEEFWAVKDVSFELRRGECLGLIGPNGAGKTTLLKMLNGLYWASRKKRLNKLDEIIDFSELREFIDSPVQSYSSGMAVRLGFSVASSLNPDVLLLDEAGGRRLCVSHEML